MSLRGAIIWTVRLPGSVQIQEPRKSARCSNSERAHFPNTVAYVKRLQRLASSRCHQEAPRRARLRHVARYAVTIAVMKPVIASRLDSPQGGVHRVAHIGTLPWSPTGLHPARPTYFGGAICTSVCSASPNRRQGVPPSMKFHVTCIRSWTRPQSIQPRIPRPRA